MSTSIAAQAQPGRNVVFPEPPTLGERNHSTSKSRCEGTLCPMEDIKSLSESDVLSYMKSDPYPGIIEDVDEGET